MAVIGHRILIPTGLLGDGLLCCLCLVVFHLDSMVAVGGRGVGWNVVGLALPRRGHSCTVGGQWVAEGGPAELWSCGTGSPLPDCCSGGGWRALSAAISFSVPASRIMQRSTAAVTFQSAQAVVTVVTVAHATLAEQGQVCGLSRSLASMLACIQNSLFVFNGSQVDFPRQALQLHADNAVVASATVDSMPTCLVVRAHARPASNQPRPVPPCLRTHRAHQHRQLPSLATKVEQS